MECKFIKHGIALSYDQILKPCCGWSITDDWQKQHHQSKSNIVNWHQHTDLLKIRTQLDNGQWPNECRYCKNIEDQGRIDSIRGNGNNAYKHYKDNDITLEIRPGNTCNFACQTCWPEASSRVSQYYHKAKLIDIDKIDSTRFDNFDFLNPVVHRIRDVVVLGGEPFYDKSCLKFLEWAQVNLNANLMIFTNGSEIDFDFIENYKGMITLIFSIDAVGRPAEYIRYGTEWNTVLKNYQKSKQFKNVQLRVNITTSVFNYIYIKDLIELLCLDWPSVVTFGVPFQPYFNESVIPLHLRPIIIDSLTESLDIITKTEIEHGQKCNATNAIQSIINNLNNQPWNLQTHQEFCEIVKKLDTVKNINIADYCDFTAQILE